LVQTNESRQGKYFGRPITSLSSQVADGIGGKQLLVCAAKNLHLALLRCQWMIKAQKLLGIGHFSGKSLQSPPNPEEERPKDISIICRLAFEIEELDLFDYLDKSQSALQDSYAAVFQHM